MILKLNIIIVLEQIINLRDIIVRAQPRLRSSQVVDPCVDVHILEVITGKDRMLHELEECGFVCGR